MSGQAELVLPVRMDVQGATAGLRKIAAEGAKAGDDVAKGLHKGQEQARDFGSELANIAKAQLTIGAVKQVAGALGDTLKRASDHTREVTKEFIQLRQQLQQIAALTGQPNSDKFALGQVRQAAAASLLPGEWKSFQELFQSYSGAQLEGKNAKLSAADATAYQQHIATFMKARGMDASEGAQLGGALLTNAQGPQKLEDVQAQFGRVFQVLEKAQTPIPQLLPQFQKVMATGLSPEESAQALAIMGPAVGGGEEATHVIAAMRAIREMKQKGSGHEFGVDAGMGKFASLKAFGENLNAREESMLASGMDQDAVNDALDKLLMENGIAADVREAQGLVGGFARQGVKLKGFETFGRYARETPNDFLTSSIADYEKSAPGQYAKSDAQEALERAQIGAGNTDIDALKREAHLQLEKERRFDQVAPMDFLRDAVGFVSKTSRDEQLVNERALSNARQRAGFAPGRMEQFGPTGNESQFTVDEALRGLLQRIAESNERMEKQAPPLEAPPPRPDGRQ